VPEFNDLNRYKIMRITLSYNTNIIKNKQEGNKIMQFKPISFDLSSKTIENDLRTFFNTCVYSTNRWIGKGNHNQKLDNDYEGYALDKNYQGMYGVSIDYDDGHYTVDQAREAFSNYVHIVHTSSSHMLDNPRHKGIQPRFRVILPFNLSDDLPYLFENEVDGDLVYNFLKSKYPQADSSVFSKGRKLYPFTGDSSRYEFYLNIPSEPADGASSIFYSIDAAELENFRDIQDLKETHGRKRSKKKLDRHMVVMLRDRKTKSRISEIDKSGTSVFCPFCDDLSSDSASGMLNIDKHGNYNLHCFHCLETYWEQDLTWSTEIEPYAFFDINSGYPAIFDEKLGKLKYFRTNFDWENYCTHEGLHKEIYKQLPRAATVVDMTRSPGLDDSGLFNLYMPSEHLEDFSTVQARIKNGEQKPRSLEGLPHTIPMIYKILKNVIGTDSDLDRYLNWLAYLIQYRRQSSLAWIIISGPGSGKGLFVERILKPIFGHHAVIIEEGNAIGDKFNIEDAACWIKVYNEVFTQHDFTLNLRRREWLKNRIGTNYILLEQKFMDKQQLKNNVNYMLLSNQPKAFLIEDNDRRMNVVNTLKTSKKIVDTKWYPGSKDQFEAMIAKEVPDFAHYIQNIEVDEYLANNVVNTPARQALIEHSREDIDFIIGKLNNGDIEYFELETIFPSPKALYGIDTNSDIRAEIEYYIKNYSSIPAKHAMEVFSHFVKPTGRTNIKRKLEMHGIITGHQLWDRKKQGNVRVYIHESQVKVK
jgi:hypothetical protein